MASSARSARTSRACSDGDAPGIECRGTPRATGDQSVAARKGGAMNHEERNRKIAEIEVAAALVLRQVGEADHGANLGRGYVLTDGLGADDRRVELIHHHMLSLL